MQSGIIDDVAVANRLLAALPLVERARLMPHLDRVRLDRGAVLVTENATTDHVWFPMDAVLSTVVTMVDGNTIEVGLVGSEGMTGIGLLLGNEPSPVAINVQVPGNAMRMRARDFMTEILEREGPARRLFLRFVNAYVAVVAQVAACNAVHTVEQRLARWLVMAEDRALSDRIPLTHEFMAMMIGVRRASVTLVAGALRAAGAIDYSKGSILIVDRKRLEGRACGCTTIIRDRIEALFA